MARSIAAETTSAQVSSRARREVWALMSGAVVVALAQAPAAASAAPKPVVLVPHGSGGDRCAAELTLASELGLAAGIELVRTPVDDRESLDDGRRRADADLALAGRRHQKPDGALTWTVELVAEGRAPVRLDGPDPSALLRALWPLDLPPLPRRAVPAAASPAALDALCAGDPARAYALSGTAIGPALWTAEAPPVVAGRSAVSPGKDDRLGLDVARAFAAARAGRHAEALIRIRRAAARLGAGEAWPLWRSSEGSGPASVTLAGDSALVLRAGALEAHDLESGAPLGRTVVGRIAPPVAALGSGRVLVAAPNAVTALDAWSGAIVWSVEIASPWPEVVVTEDRIVVAGTREIVALAASSGEAVWRLEVPVEPSAGPVRVGSRIVVPAETELVVVDLARGTLVARADVGDELVGPLVVSGSDVWCQIGADGVGRLDLATLAPSGGSRESARLDRLTRGVFGASWPPALTDRGAVVAAMDARRGPFYARVDGAGEGPPAVLTRGLVGPARSLGGPRTLGLEKKRDAVVALDGEGKTLWRVALGAPLRAAVVELGLLWVAAGTKVWAIDAVSGRVEQTVDVGEPVGALAVSARGAVAVGDGGTAWGLPSIEDPRVLPVLRQLRQAEARAALALGRSAEAAQALEAARALDPDDVEALLALARIADKGAGGPRAWLRVLEAVRPRDAAGVEARTRLAATIGLVARVPLAGAPRAVVAAQGRALVEVGAEVVALDAAGNVLWRRPGQGLVRNGDAILVDGTAIRAADGVPAVGATSTSTTPVAGVAVSASGVVTITDAVRRTAGRPLDLGAAGPAAASATHAWIARDATILVLDLRPSAK